ncbi:mitogen-activated protein kinase kinase 5-like [Salvia splendens]|uniref:mitogen-activated protein kinase kinase 5-like n=1 Tax=Salvia splendens TaxID=180675 RepID=UPI001C2695A4|nr:mitogen-activated protein kinase kinase 5-like [Salvia splendens]XP_041999591.1 mitogen-activated protein kinase kinase 5-like [Salvia splendens]
MSRTDKVSLVRCPKCEKIVTDFCISRCGGCGAILRRPSSPPQTKTISSAPSASSESSSSPYSFDEFTFPFSTEDLLQSSAWQGWEWDPPQNSRYISRWRVVKHAVVATLRLHRLGTDRNWNKTVPNLPDFDLKPIIEASGTGKVYRVVHRHTGLTYALKEFRDDSSQRQQISADVQILKELDHPNLVKCYDVVFGDAGVSFLLLEPLDRGFSNVTCKFDLLTFAYQLLLGLNFLHRNRIWQWDIKLYNIFVDHTGQVKLLYLGKTLSNTTPFSPEIGAIHDEFSWDVWSVGLCILKLGKSSGRFSEIEDVQEQPSTELLRFLSACMQADVLKR